MDLTIIPTNENSANIKYLELSTEVFQIILLNRTDDEPNKQVYPDHPLADSKTYECSILNAKKLTCGDLVKEGREYEPGDTIGILPCNTEADLVKLFEHLNISQVVHENIRIIIRDPDVKLKSKPAFIDQDTTLYDIFKNCIDIRCIPKKSLIRLMVDYTQDENEREKLEELCSKGTRKYEEILENNKTFIDLLTSFPACHPPVLRLLENLPPLLARPYSIASSPLACMNSLKIVFTVAHSVVNGTVREGICSGMLKSIINMEDQNKCERMSVKMFYRKPGRFRLPKENKHPLILIGPGSGVAPFIGFLEHRKMLQSKGTIWLFYGCRYKRKDFLFRRELREYVNCGVLSKLIVSFSREPGEDIKYVQDNLKKYGKEIFNMICDEEALIYVCGDANGLRKDVMDTLIAIIQEHTGSTPKEANGFIKYLQKEKRYLQDLWL